VGTFDAVTREHVLLALNEYDETGAEEFLRRYGFKRSRGYVLVHRGRDYDSKAVLGAACRFATGAAAHWSDFSGGKDGAAKVLLSLGFEVTSPNDPGSEHPWDASLRKASDVGSDAARNAWATAAREILLVAAKRYHSVVTYKELAREVQQQTRIRTNQLMHYWIGDVLGRVSAECSRRGEPLLSALCVNAEGSVGPGYALAVVAATGVEPGDLDDHAAHERLACHRYFAAPDLPPDGGVPALTPKLRATRERARRAKSPEPKIEICPRCHTQLSSTGICGFCD
jgi:hypothetical protein